MMKSHLWVDLALGTIFEEEGLESLEAGTRKTRNNR